MSSNFIYLDNNNKLINLSSVDLTADKLTVDDITIDNKTITMTGSTDNTATLTVGTNGALSIVTTDTAKLKGTNVHLDSDNGVNIDGNTVVTGTLGVTGTTTLSGQLQLPTTITNSAPSTFTVIDNNASAFSIGSTGKLDLLKVISTDSSEGITMSGTLGVSGNTTVGGNVGIGIGTASPSAKLYIESDAGDTNNPKGFSNNTQADSHTGLFLCSSGNQINEKYGLQFGGLSNPPNIYSHSGIFGVMTSNSGNTVGDITFDFRGDVGNNTEVLTERMRITHSGNVGIGTTSPSEKLHVKGNVKIEATETLPISIYSSSGKYAGIKFYSDGVTATNDYNGYIEGDHTNNVLVIHGKTGVKVSGGELITSGINVTGGNIWSTHSSDLDIFTASNKDLHLGEGGSTLTHHLTIKSGGNVGIGTTNPTKKLHLYNGNTSVDNEPLLILERNKNNDVDVGQECCMEFWNSQSQTPVASSPQCRIGIVGHSNSNGDQEDEARGIFEIKLNPSHYYGTPLLTSSLTTVLKIDGGTGITFVYDALSINGYSSGTNNGGYALGVTGKIFASSDIVCGSGGRILVTDTTNATNATDGSLQTNGGLSVTRDAYIGAYLNVNDGTTLRKDGTWDTLVLKNTYTSGTNNTRTAGIKFCPSNAYGAYIEAFVDNGETDVAKYTNLKLYGSKRVWMTNNTYISGNLDVTEKSNGRIVTVSKDSAGYLEIFHRGDADEGIHFSDSGGSSQARLYLSGTTVVHSGTWNDISDSRVKLNQQLADNNILAMAFDNIDLYTYNYTEQYAAENNKSSTNIVYGFIAQNVIEKTKNISSQFGTVCSNPQTFPNDKVEYSGEKQVINDLHTINKTDLSILLWAKVKEQQQEIITLRTNVTTQEQKINELSSIITKLKNASSFEDFKSQL